MEEVYKINKNGIITLNGVAIQMIDGTDGYNKYVKYLENGGTVVETDERTIADIELEQNILPYVLDLRETINKPIENSSEGITTTFKTVDGLTVVIKNGLVISIG